MIIAKNLVKTYAGEPILDGVDIKLGNNKKIGVVGQNGCGKTTLFRLLVGEEQPTLGSIDLENEVIGYIPQEFTFPHMQVGEYLEQQLDETWEFYKITALADQLRFTNFDPKQTIQTMSEGQKMKVKLIEVLLSDPTILFIDEPTNHLDIDGIMWFENYIVHLEKTVVMISHDRSFLNNTADEIWEIEHRKIIKFVGNYDTYKAEKLKLINKWDEEYKLFLKKKAQLEQLLANVRKIGDGKARGRAVKAAKKRIDREIVQNEKQKYVKKQIAPVSFETDIRQTKLMVSFTDVTKAYGTNTVFENLNFELRGKEKVWLFGPNGGGKTTLVKIITGEEQPTAGEVKIGENLKIGYFAQKQTHLDYDKRLLDHFLAETGCDYGEAFGLLRKFLFDKDAIAKKVSNLSPGERARFAFAIFAYANYDMLILDEPTNHLDIETKEVIEKSLSEYTGTLLLVSHDRYFVERTGIEKLLNLRNGRLEYL